MIYLHIGYEKTGTTSLQDFLWRHQTALYEQGIYFPNYLEANHAKLVLYAINSDKSDDLRMSCGVSKEEYSHFLDTFPGEFLRNLKSFHAAGFNLLFTSEHLSSRLTDLPELTKLYNLLALLSTDIKVIVYLRKQEDLITSSYSTSIKCGATYDFTWFCDNFTPNLDYYAVLHKWSEVFGRENLIVRPYQRSQLINQSIIDDFLQILNINDKLMMKSENPDLNKSLDSVSLEILRKFNKYCPQFFNDKRNTARDEIISILENSSFGRQLVMPQEKMKKIASRFENSNKKIAIAYLNNPRGQFFLENKFSPDDSEQQSPCLTVDNVIDFSFYLWETTRNTYLVKTENLTETLNTVVTCQEEILRLKRLSPYRLNRIIYQVYRKIAGILSMVKSLGLLATVSTAFFRIIRKK